MNGSDPIGKEARPDRKALSSFIPKGSRKPRQPEPIKPIDLPECSQYASFEERTAVRRARLESAKALRPTGSPMASDKPRGASEANAARILAGDTFRSGKHKRGPEPAPSQDKGKRS